MLREEHIYATRIGQRGLRIKGKRKRRKDLQEKPVTIAKAMSMYMWMVSWNLSILGLSPAICHIK